MSAPPKTVLAATPEEEAAIRAAVRDPDLSGLGEGSAVATAAHVPGLVALLSVINERDETHACALGS